MPGSGHFPPLAAGCRCAVLWFGAWDTVIISAKNRGALETGKGETPGCLVVCNLGLFTAFNRYRCFFKKHAISNYLIYLLTYIMAKQLLS